MYEALYNNSSGLHFMKYSLSNFINMTSLIVFPNIHAMKRKLSPEKDADSLRDKQDKIPKW